MMIRPNDSAFPTDQNNALGGLTARHYFAAMAMQGLLSDPTATESMPRDEIARTAVGMADALIRSLNGATRPTE